MYPQRMSISMMILMFTLEMFYPKVIMIPMFSFEL
jgi:hypothetical protein